MTRRFRKNYPSFFQVPTGTHRSIVGAREAELGRVFVTIEDGDSRERMFLVSTFDGNKVEMDALFETLRAKEVARVKSKNRKEIVEARVRHERAQAESDPQDEYSDHRDLGEESSAEFEPDEAAENSEIIAESDSFGLEPLPEVEEEEIEVED
jgi:hypothetical protein